jgi:ankyrin repeat protein
VIKKILLISGICLALAIGAVIWFFVAVYMSMERGEEHQRQLREEQRSGKWDFGDQPALFAVAQAIVKNDQDAIRVAAKALPDLQTPGRDGTTLLYFAVTQSWQRPELAEAVRTLLSLGADPNYTNGKRDSFAMANAVHASAPVLRAMLEAGGNPNARDEFGRPMIVMNWYLGYYPDQARSRFYLLLDHRRYQFRDAGGWIGFFRLSVAALPHENGTRQQARLCGRADPARARRRSESCRG